MLAFPLRLPAYCRLTGGKASMRSRAMRVQTLGFNRKGKAKHQLSEVQQPVCLLTRKPDYKPIRQLIN